MVEDGTAEWRIGDVVDGRYRVTRIHGQGGMGLVYRVRHLEWGVDLAVKSPRAELFRDAGDRDRFVAEADAWVSLGLHPNVCNCHYVRTVDGIPRVFAEYVPGGSLLDWIRDGRLYEGRGLERILDLAVQMAWGLEHAHASGLVHQDVKPANVLIDADGIAKITDFGLARARPVPKPPRTLPGDGSLPPSDASSPPRSTSGNGSLPPRDASGDGSFPPRSAPADGSPAPRGTSGDGGRSPRDAVDDDGSFPPRGASADGSSAPRDAVDDDGSVLVPTGGLTPAYASPEQAEGLPVGRRTDIYSFGASVLQMFTGEVVWRAGPLAGRTLDLWRRQGRVPDSIAELLARCLELDPDRRPRTMAEVAGDFADAYRRFAGRPYPRTMPRAARLRADELNNRALSLLDLGRPDDARRTFEEAIEADPHHAEATFNLGLTRWRGGEITDERLVSDLEGVGAGTGDPWQVRYLLGLVHLERGDPEAAHELLRRVIHEAPDDQDAAAALALASDPETGRAVVRNTWNPPWQRLDKKKMPWQRRQDFELAMRFSPGGKYVVTGSYGGEVSLWDVAGQRHVTTIQAHDRGVLSVDVDATGRHAVSGVGLNTVQLWDLDSGRLLNAWRVDGPNPHGRAIGAVRLHTHGDDLIVLCAASTGKVHVWNGRTGEFLGFIGDSAEGLTAVETDGLRTVAGGWDKSVWTVDRETGRQELKGHSGPIGTLAISADGRTALSGGRFQSDRTIRLWDLVHGRCLRTFTGHEDGVTGVAFSGDAFVVSTSRDRTVRIWETHTGRCLRTLRGHRDVVSALAVPLPGLALSAADDDTLITWGLPSRTPHAPFRLSRPRGHAELDELSARAASLIAEYGQALNQRDLPRALDALKRAREVPGHERSDLTLNAWRGFGRHAARDGLRSTWIAADLSGHTASIWSIDAAAEAPVGASASADRTVRIWDLARRECRTVLKGHTNLVESVSLSADGTRALSVGRDRRVLLWSTETGEGTEVTGLPDGYRSTARISPDGRTALIPFHRDFVLWDLGSARVLRTFTGHRGQITSLWFAPDGRRVVSGGYDASVRLWDAGTGECLAVFSYATGRLAAKNARLTPDGRRVVASMTGGDGGGIAHWTTETGEPGPTMREKQSSNGSALTDDGRFVLAAGSGGALQIWDLRDASHIRTAAEPDRGTMAIAATYDGFHALTGSASGHIRLWELDWTWTVPTTP
ncbi:protein kinase domain-containing protein [Actinomadura rupiterrae]|uniref:protein kinase domain-containing protein n=1 Tax=Actinomadura rupiterrae TaxID=559627 RepID=UPI0020A56D4E|nr:protein kinase [Actinomadura rupiterrae]MCP2339921.1 WD40 repeat protein/serine/threonine protein kinase [Actinomadura rupiterrae]